MLRPQSRLARHVLFFGLPLVLGLACHAAFNLVDTLLVGQLAGPEGAAAIAVTGLCDPVSTFQTILLNGPIAGAGVLLALARGAGNHDGVRRTALQALGFVAALCVAISVPGWLLAGEIATAMGAAEGSQHQQCTEYLRVMLGGGLTAGLFLYLTTTERALGRTGVFLAFFLISNVLNLVLGLFLIYGDGPFPHWFPDWLAEFNRACGFPRLGVVGSAWSTVGARGISALLLLGLAVLRGPMRGALSWLVPGGEVALSLLRIGLWNNGQIAARGLAGGIFIRCVQAAGGGREAVVGGIFVGMKVELLLTLLAFGWGAAAQTLVATSLGGGKPDRARHEERLCVAIATLAGLALVLPLVLFAGPVAAFFNPEPGLVSWGSAYLHWMAPAFAAAPLNIVLSQALVARNRLKTPVLIDSAVLLGGLAPALVAATLLRAPLEVLLGLNAGAGLLLSAVYVALARRSAH